MKKTVIQVFSILLSIIGISFLTDFGAYRNYYYGTVVVVGLISSLLMHYFSKRNLEDQSIVAVAYPSLLTSIAVYFVSVVTFQLVFTVANAVINPLWGMTTDNTFINWPLSILSFMFPAQFLGSYLWECSNAKSRKIIWFTSLIFGTYLYAAFVLSGII